MKRSIASNTGVDRAELTRTVAVINGKGGVGKTSITANVAGQMAAAGWRVLVVDLDPAGNLGLDLGYVDTDDDDKGMDLMLALVKGKPVEPLEDVRPGLDVVVGGPELHDAQAILHARAGKRPDPRLALARALSPVAGDYDIILIDCPPGADALQTTAMGAARWIVVPVKGDTGSRRGVEEVAARIEQIEGVNDDIDLLGVVLFAVDTAASRVKRRARDMVTETMGVDDALFTTVIRHSSTVSQDARHRHVLVQELVKPGSTGTTAASLGADYQALTVEMTERLRVQESEVGQ